MQTYRIVYRIMPMRVFDVPQCDAVSSATRQLNVNLITRSMSSVHSVEPYIGVHVHLMVLSTWTAYVLKSNVEI